MKVAVVGGGKLGTTITEALLGGNNEVTVIDSNPEKLQKLSDRYDIRPVEGNAIETGVLKEIDISSYDILISATDSDELNMVICRFAKELGCPQVIARVRAPEHVAQEDFIKRSMNIDYVVNPDMACAQEIYNYLTQKYSLTGGKLVTGKTAILECGAEKLPGLAGNALKDLGHRLEGVLIAAISRNGKIIVPNGSTVLEPADTLYIIGTEKRINEIGAKVRRGREHTSVRRVMLAGGGKTGFYLARMLSNAGISVKIIERDRERCEYLSGQLEEALVLNGDATDTSLLAEENLQGMNAFVAVTGFDEENLLLSLIAKRSGVEDVVTKVSRNSYGSLTESLGVDMIINPMEMCASNILRYIEKEGIVIFSKIIQGQAEFVEIFAERNMILTEKPLSALQLPPGVLIASVHRGNDVIIPKGDTHISAGDRVMILSLLSSTALLESLLKKRR
ncbi:MAG: Trk system potassium transporter TrkA [Firmicutes bacterium]|nr:Trk system potassium transporter TrkA [Bacillota bacterium]MBQ3577268.1 Trk system potassium transporter TrkA [Bacillota bacterium]MBQ6260718.1 Trk system potassium transporter TrkA [Bacillota bacterium]